MHIFCFYSSICDRILENLPFGHINQSDVIIHVYQEKEAIEFCLKLACAQKVGIPRSGHIYASCNQLYTCITTYLFYIPFMLYRFATGLEIMEHSKLIHDYYNHISDGPVVHVTVDIYYPTKWPHGHKQLYWVCCRMFVCKL